MCGVRRKGGGQGVGQWAEAKGRGCIRAAIRALSSAKPLVPALSAPTLTQSGMKCHALSLILPAPVGKLTSFVPLLQVVKLGTRHQHMDRPSWSANLDQIPPSQGPLDMSQIMTGDSYPRDIMALWPRLSPWWTLASWVIVWTYITDDRERPNNPERKSRAQFRDYAIPDHEESDVGQNGAYLSSPEPKRRRRSPGQGLRRISSGWLNLSLPAAMPFIRHIYRSFHQNCIAYHWQTCCWIHSFGYSPCGLHDVWLRRLIRRWVIIVRLHVLLIPSSWIAIDPWNARPMRLLRNQWYRKSGEGLCVQRSSFGSATSSAPLPSVELRLRLRSLRRANPWGFPPKMDLCFDGIIYLSAVRWILSWHGWKADCGKHDSCRRDRDWPLRQWVRYVSARKGFYDGRAWSTMVSTFDSSLTIGTHRPVRQRCWRSVRPTLFTTLEPGHQPHGRWLPIQLPCVQGDQGVRSPRGPHRPMVWTAGVGGPVLHWLYWKYQEADRARIYSKDQQDQNRAWTGHTESLWMNINIGQWWVEPVQMCGDSQEMRWSCEIFWQSKGTFITHKMI